MSSAFMKSLSKYDSSFNADDWDKSLHEIFSKTKHNIQQVNQRYDHGSYNRHDVTSSRVSDQINSRYQSAAVSTQPLTDDVSPETHADESLMNESKKTIQIKESQLQQIFNRLDKLEQQQMLFQQTQENKHPNETKQPHQTVASYQVSKQSEEKLEKLMNYYQYLEVQVLEMKKDIEKHRQQLLTVNTSSSQLYSNNDMNAYGSLNNSGLAAVTDVVEAIQADVTKTRTNIMKIEHNYNELETWREIMEKQLHKLQRSVMDLSIELQEYSMNTSTAAATSAQAAAVAAVTAAMNAQNIGPNAPLTLSSPCIADLLEQVDSVQKKSKQQQLQLIQIQQHEQDVSVQHQLELEQVEVSLQHQLTSNIMKLQQQFTSEIDLLQHKLRDNMPLQHPAVESKEKTPQQTDAALEGKLTRRLDLKFTDLEHRITASVNDSLKVLASRQIEEATMNPRNAVVGDVSAEALIQQDQPTSVVIAEFRNESSGLDVREDKYRHYPQLYGLIGKALSKISKGSIAPSPRLEDILQQYQAVLKTVDADYDCDLESQEKDNDVDSVIASSTSTELLTSEVETLKREVQRLTHDLSVYAERSSNEITDRVSNLITNPIDQLQSELYDAVIRVMAIEKRMEGVVMELDAIEGELEKDSYVKKKIDLEFLSPSSNYVKNYEQTNSAILELKKDLSVLSSQVTQHTQQLSHSLSTQLSTQLSSKMATQQELLTSQQQIQSQQLEQRLQLQVDQLEKSYHDLLTDLSNQKVAVLGFESKHFNTAGETQTISRRITSLETILGQTKGQLQVSVDRLNDKISSGVDMQVNSLLAKVVDLQSDLTGTKLLLSSATSNLSQHIQSNDEKIQAISSHIDNLDSSLNESIETLQSKSSSLDGKITTLESRVDEVDGKVVDVVDTLNGVSNKTSGDIDGLSRKISEDITQSINELNENLKMTQKTLAETLNDSIACNQALIDKKSDIESQLADLKSSHEAMEGNMTHHIRRECKDAVDSAVQDEIPRVVKTALNVAINTAVDTTIKLAVKDEIDDLIDTKIDKRLDSKVEKSVSSKLTNVVNSEVIPLLRKEMEEFIKTIPAQSHSIQISDNSYLDAKLGTPQLSEPTDVTEVEVIESESDIIVDSTLESIEPASSLSLAYEQTSVGIMRYPSPHSDISDDRDDAVHSDDDIVDSNDSYRVEAIPYDHVETAEEMSIDEELVMQHPPHGPDLTSGVTTVTESELFDDDIHSFDDSDFSDIDIDEQLQTISRSLKPVDSTLQVPAVVKADFDAVTENEKEKTPESQHNASANSMIAVTDDGIRSSESALSSTNNCSDTLNDISKLHASTGVTVVSPESYDDSDWDADESSVSGDNDKSQEDDDINDTDAIHSNDIVDDVESHVQAYSPSYSDDDSDSDSVAESKRTSPSLTVSQMNRRFDDDTGVPSDNVETKSEDSDRIGQHNDIDDDEDSESEYSTSSYTNSNSFDCDSASDSSFASISSDVQAAPTSKSLISNPIASSNQQNLSDNADTLDSPDVTSSTSISEDTAPIELNPVVAATKSSVSGSTSTEIISSKVFFPNDNSSHTEITPQTAGRESLDTTESHIQFSEVTQRIPNLISAEVQGESTLPQAVTRALSIAVDAPVSHSGPLTVKERLKLRQEALMAARRHTAPNTPLNSSGSSL